MMGDGSDGRRVDDQWMRGAYTFSLGESMQSNRCKDTMRSEESGRKARLEMMKMISYRKMEEGGMGETRLTRE
jgi:hypothetical protein